MYCSRKCTCLELFQASHYLGELGQTASAFLICKMGLTLTPPPRVERKKMRFIIWEQTGNEHRETPSSWSVITHSLVACCHISCPFLPLRDDPSWKHLFYAHDIKHYLKPSARSSVAYGKLLATWNYQYQYHLKISPHKIELIFPSSHTSLHLPLQCLDHSSSIIWNSKLALSFSFIPHTQINQESLSYFNSIISLLCFPFEKHCLVQDSEQLPGVASVSLSSTSSTGKDVILIFLKSLWKTLHGCLLPSLQILNASLCVTSLLSTLARSPL